MRGGVIPQPSREAQARGERFKDRRRRWRAIKRPVPHALVEPIAPAVMAAVFLHGVRVVGPVQEYAYRTDMGQTVHIRVDNWHWYCLDGTADGRGLYELWAWAFDIPVSRAAYEIRTMAAAQPQKMGKAA